MYLNEIDSSISMWALNCQLILSHSHKNAKCYLHDD